MLVLAACSSGAEEATGAAVGTPTGSTSATEPTQKGPQARTYAVMAEAPGKGVLLLGGQFGPEGSEATTLTDL